MRVKITVEGGGKEWVLAFSRADRELLDIMKNSIGQADRRWDASGQCWLVTAEAAMMVELCAEFEQCGAVVTKPDTLAPDEPSGSGLDSAQHWEAQFKMMDETARILFEQVQFLTAERDDLVIKLTAATTETTPPNDWAEVLFAAVGPRLREPVFKALTKCLHPDLVGSELTHLQQQLNAARDRKRR